jgi:hypothetical protein
MLDQSFSSKSFQEIFDNENRKGINVEEKYKTDFVDSLAKVGELKNLIKQIQQERDFDRKKILYADKKRLKKERDTIVTEVLDGVTDGINNHIINL